MTVAVLMGGPSGESAVSLLSGCEVVGDLVARGQQVRVVLLNERADFRIGRLITSIDEAAQLKKRFIEDPVFAASGADDAFEAPQSPLDAVQTLKERGTSIVFIALHGHPGEDGSLQAFFEWSDLAYTGAGPECSALALDKTLYKAFLRDAGLPCADSLSFRRCEWLNEPAQVLAALQERIGFPLVLKTKDSGSSVGVQIVHDAEAARETLASQFASCDAVLAEKFIPGREFTCAVLKDAHSEKPEILPLVEIRPLAATWFDHAAKYEIGGAQEICPAPVDVALSDLVQSMSLEVHERLGCDGITRTDFILCEERGPLILETNTIPGLTKQSLAPLAAKVAGIGFSGLIDRLIEMGHRRVSTRRPHA
ncbi:MAG: D-alanine--D-alanine ligase [Planctomycetota bacterium]